MSTSALSTISFLSAVKKGLWQVVKICIKNAAFYNLQEADEKQNNALHILSQKGHPEFIQDLISVGLEINATNTTGKTPLHLAIAANSLEIVESLLNHSAKVNSIDKYGNTPIFLATTSGNIKIVQLLYQHGADINRTDKCGNTVLHEAARRNHPSMIVFYLTHHISINKKNSSQKTALQVAIESKSSDIAIVLLGYKAETKQSPEHESLLHLAVRMGDARVAKLLLKSNSVKLLDEELRTPLHLAAEYKETEIARCLLAKGADINDQDGDGYSPFHIAVQNGDLDMVQLFLQHAQVKNENEGDKDSIRGHINKFFNIRVLNYTLRTYNGDNVMHLLAASHLAEHLKMRMFYQLRALDLRPLVVEANKDFRTVLHLAYLRFCRALIDAMVHLGADVDELDRFGKNANYYCTDPHGSRVKVIKKESFKRKNANVS